MTVVALTVCMCVRVCVYSRETVATLEEALRVAEKALGRCANMEPLLVTARDRLQVFSCMNGSKLAYCLLLRNVCSQAAMIIL